MVHGPVYINDAHAGLDGNLSGLIIDRDDPVHGAHVKEGLTVIERQVSVAPTGSARTNGHVVPAAIGQGFTALFQGGGAGDKGARANGANQRGQFLPLHEVRVGLVVRIHFRAPVPQLLSGANCRRGSDTG